MESVVTYNTSNEAQPKMSKVDGFETKAQSETTVQSNIKDFYGVYRVANGEHGGQFYKLVFITSSHYNAQRFRHEKYYRYGDTGLGFFKNRDLNNVPRFLKLHDPRIIG